MNSYSAGMLDQLLTQQRYTRTPDGMGGVTRTLSTVGTHWAHIRPLTGRERVEAGQRLEQRVSYLVVIRSGAELLTDDVLQWEGRTLNVRVVKITPRSQWLELECELGAAS